MNILERSQAVSSSLGSEVHMMISQHHPGLVDGKVGGGQDAAADGAADTCSSLLAGGCSSSRSLVLKIDVLRATFLN